jgi:hypothetical protein
LFCSLCVLFVFTLFDLVLQDLTSFKVWFFWLVVLLEFLSVGAPRTGLHLQFGFSGLSSCSSFCPSVPPGLGFIFSQSDLLNFVLRHPVPAASFVVIYLCHMSRSGSPSQELRFPHPSFITASIFFGNARPGLRPLDFFVCHLSLPNFHPPLECAPSEPAKFSSTSGMRLTLGFPARAWATSDSCFACL